MKFDLHLEMDNAAFADGGAARELQTILKQVAANVPGMIGEEWVDRNVKYIFDRNGNRCGQYHFTGRLPDPEAD